MSGKPRFQQVKDFLLSGIENQRYPVGSRIPTEMQLAQQFNVSRMTVHKAIRDLVNDGHLVRYQGQGTFVCESKPVSSFADIRNIAEEIAERGHQYSNRIVKLEQIKASSQVATQLGIRTGSDIFHSRIVHLENGIPVQLEERYVNPAFAPEYLAQDYRKITPNQYLTQTSPASDAEHIIEAILPDELCCELLEIQPEDPCLRVHRRTWSQQHLISSAYLTYPGSRYRLQSESHFR
ncbi:histidine utilization repressor [Hahella sp. CCB-MM4]|uniref:histidine utilization repressor n=1 Tax=Hahella sp. (strain CCB-MM4) TaxID=1926491 RepID=UPI000B9B433A|nr:histidine utilization repressor [Hahella sp. CCB-MM4]OZG71362.1 histidine utilization repressor [Hahella sp. CCB-MM4]